eukprot:SAG11_NODE_21507_length_424_cov_0.556923_1_plen_55_part_10
MLEGRRRREWRRMSVVPVGCGCTLHARDEILGVEAVHKRILARCLLIPSPVRIAR